MRQRTKGRGGGATRRGAPPAVHGRALAGIANKQKKGKRGRQGTLTRGARALQELDEDLAHVALDGVSGLSKALVAHKVLLVVVAAGGEGGGGGRGKAGMSRCVR